MCEVHCFCKYEDRHGYELGQRNNHEFRRLCDHKRPRHSRSGIDFIDTYEAIRASETSLVGTDNIGDLAVLKIEASG